MDALETFYQIVFVNKMIGYILGIIITLVGCVLIYKNRPDRAGNITIKAGDYGLALKNSPTGLIVVVLGVVIICFTMFTKSKITVKQECPNQVPGQPPIQCDVSVEVKSKDKEEHPPAPL